MSNLVHSHETLTSSQFELLKAQVFQANEETIEKLASHCKTLDLKNPNHIPVQLTLMAKIHELEDEIDNLATLTYQKYLSLTLL